jgi:hypothetical protein
MRIRVLRGAESRRYLDQGSQKNIHPTRTDADRPVPVELECRTRAEISQHMPYLTGGWESLRWKCYWR